MKKIIAALLLSATAVAAQAQITGSASVVSDYRFRGISQSQGAGAVQAGFDLSHKSGFYAGNWNSSVSSEVYTNGSGVEHDVYAGFKKTVAGFDLDVGLLSYFYAGAKDFNTDEVYASIGRGPISAKISHTYSDKYFGAENARGTQYYEINLAQPVNKAVTLVAHVGRTNVANQTASDYNDANAGVVFKVGGFDLGARYYVNNDMTAGFETANTVNGEKNYDRGFVLSVARQF